MTELLQVKPAESVYDPTCGTGGMLLSASRYLKSKNKEHRNLRLFGQERNVTTSSIARMNLFLHGIEDFEIARADTLEDPHFVENDQLRTFDVVLANPPYSISQWNRDAWKSDRWGRNTFGTPPQGRADYAFFQHIVSSMDKKTGRCAVLFPHGVLFRKEEIAMRRAMVEADVIDTVIGLGPNLFYNAPMESCIVICRSKKPKAHKGTVLFIDAINDVTKQRGNSYLSDENQNKITAAFNSEEDVVAFSKRVKIEVIDAENFDLTVHRYVERVLADGGLSVVDAISGFKDAHLALNKAVTHVLGSSMGQS
jgi:type I restriction enzyme M protein